MTRVRRPRFRSRFRPDEPPGPPVRGLYGLRPGRPGPSLDEPAGPPPKPAIVLAWYCLASLGGFGIGALAATTESRQALAASPLTATALFLAIGLIVFGAMRRRPVRDLLPVRALVIGCGLAALAALTGHAAWPRLAGG
jgi:hypothetical protein